jgi:hypothetical protein
MAAGYPAASGRILADEMRYSLGSIQGQQELHVPSGGAAFATLGFYNIDGNVPTTVELSVVDAPLAWEVRLERPGEIGDEAGAVSLTVEPSTPQDVATACADNLRESVWLAPRGYICADMVRVRIEVPGTVPAGTRGTVHIGAVAQWSELGGAGQFPQERDFLFDVEVGAGASSEAPAEPGEGARWPLLGVVCFGGLLLLRHVLVKSGRLA